MKDLTKAHLDHGIYFFDQRDWTVYAGTFAHFYGCSFYGGIPSLIEAHELVEMVGMDGIRVRRDGEEAEYPVKDAPPCWRRHGLERVKNQLGKDYDSLPDGDAAEQAPIYPADDDL